MAAWIHVPIAIMVLCPLVSCARTLHMYISSTWRMSYAIWAQGADFPHLEPCFFSALLTVPCGYHGGRGDAELLSFMAFLRAFAVAGQACVELLYDAEDGPALRALGRFAVAVQVSPLTLSRAAAPTS